MHFASSLVWLTFTSLLLWPIQGEKILFFFGFGSYSHRVSVWPLVTELAHKGHEVTFLSPFPNKNPDPQVKDMVVAPKFLEQFGEVDMISMRLMGGRRLGQISSIIMLPRFGTLVCEWILSEPGFTDWMNNNSFDLTGSVMGYWYDAYGIPIEAYIPDLKLNAPGGEDITLWGKLLANCAFLAMHFIKSFYFFPRLESLGRKYLDMDEFPLLHTLEANTSLILLNNHFSEEFPRSLPPGVVEVGGLHCKERTGKIPKDMEDFIGKHKFVYISFGTAADVSKGPKKLLQKFLDTFQSLQNFKFIWKLDDPQNLNLPPNVFTATWMPQQEILAHPQIVAFVSHGGLLGTQEAAFNGVPMITFPIFAEQDYNAERIGRMKRGIVLDIGTFSTDDLISAINTLHTELKYKSNAVQLSKRFKDRQAKPLETGVWWIEYILRNENPHEYLMPLSRTQFWFQKRLLDVWVTILILCVVGFYIYVKILLYLFVRFCRKKQSKKLEFNKKKMQ